MKYITLLILVLSITISCQNQEENTDLTDITVSTKNMLDVEPQIDEVVYDEAPKTGEFIVKYPNGNIETEGWNNSEGLRDGIWYSYYENGIKWSETSYKDGIKEGHSIVFYPNGKVRYLGDYSSDKKIGHWVFYLESGEIDVEKDY